MLVTMVTYTAAWNVAFKTAKPLWKIQKYKINIFYKTNLTAERKAPSTWQSHFTEKILRRLMN